MTDTSMIRHMLHPLNVRLELPRHLVLHNSSSHLENKNRDLSPELQEQWEKDRAKKAKKKQERELERLIAVMDPATPRKGGKKSRKATIAAAKLNPSIDIPHRIIDMESLELQIRRFIADASRSSMPLPATDKATRQKVHILAGAFNLKSKSNGKGTGRSTTLIKTKHTGYALNEKKIAGMMKGFKARASHDGPAWKGKGNQDFSGQPKTQDGDVVGRVRFFEEPYHCVLTDNFRLRRRSTRAISASRC